MACKLQRHVACCMAANWDMYPDAGISGLSDAEHAESFQEANEQQPKQEQRHEANGVLPQPSAEQVIKQDVRLEPKAEPPQPPQPINLYPNFPMPPEMPLGAGPSVDAWQGEEQADAGFMQQGRQPRGEAAASAAHARAQAGALPWMVTHRRACTEVYQVRKLCCLQGSQATQRYSQWISCEHGWSASAM